MACIIKYRPMEMDEIKMIKTKIIEIKKVDFILSIFKSVSTVFSNDEKWYRFKNELNN